MRRGIYSYIAQRIDALGVVSSGQPRGFAVAAMHGDQVLPVIISDRGAIIAWADGRPVEGGIYAQRIRHE